MIQERDFLLRAIKLIVLALAGGRKRAVAEKAPDVTSDEGDPKCLDEVFEETVGISASFLDPAVVGLIPGMLAVNPDGDKAAMAARLLIEIGKGEANGRPFLLASRRILAESSGLPLAPELDLLRREAFELLRELLESVPR